MTVPTAQSPPDVDDSGLLPINALTVSGERALAGLERGVLERRLDVQSGDLRLLCCAVETIADLGRLLTVAAAGDLDTLDALRDRFKLPPGVQLRKDLTMFVARRPIGPVIDGPCGVGPIDLGLVMWTGFHLGGGVRDPAWVYRAMREYASLAGPVERVLGTARTWMNDGRQGPLLEAFGGLHAIGDVGQPMVSFPCLDEQQVCLAEMLNFVWETVGSPTSFPLMDSLAPADICVGYTGVITVRPAGAFPPQGSAGGAFPTIDRHPADVVSWTTTAIVLRIPANLEPGCHTVGWGYLNDPAAVVQLRAIGEQCLPWYPSNSFKNTPMMIWRDDLQFSVIGEAAMSFDANGSDTITVEACTRANLNWTVTLSSCLQTQATRQVSMMRNGQVFRPTLPTSGQLPVADADDATYALRAVSRIGAQTCATTMRSVTIRREKIVRIAPILDRCIDTQSTVTLAISLSCSAPTGGLPVTVSSSAPARIAGSAATIEQGDRTTTIDIQAGADCGPVTLTAAVPGHTSAQVDLLVVSTPQITAMSPAQMLTCDDVALTLTGTCLGDPSLPPRAVLAGPTGALDAAVKVVQTQTEVRITHGPLNAGSYTVILANCGRAAFTPTPLTVTHRPPVITNPLAANVTTIQLCATPTLTLTWRVHFTQTVLLTRGGLALAQRAYDPCQNVTDSATDNLPAVTGGVSYTLTAFNPDGASVTGTLSIPPSSLAPPRSTFVVSNASNEAVNAFLINAEDKGGTFLGTFQPGQSALVNIPNCRIRGIASLSPGLVKVHNTNFPNGQVDPTAVATVRTAGPWSRNFSGYRLGHASSGAEGVSI